MRLKRTITAVFLSLALAPSLSLAEKRAIRIEGHRGARAVLSENTLPAMEYALGLGVDVLEMDLAVTKDKRLVLSHDPRVNPVLCLDPDGDRIAEDEAPWIHELTLEQLRKYDCGTLRNPRFPSQKPVSDRESGRITPVPTLDEVFELAKRKGKGKPVRFNIETKSFRDIHRNDQPVAPTEFARLWVETVKKHGMLERAVLQSFDWRTLVAARGIDKRVRIVPLTEDPDENLANTARVLGAKVVSPKWDMPNVNAKTVRELHRMGVRIVPWTANTPEAWEKLVSLGVDGIITDDPAALQTFLKKRSESKKP